MTFPHDRSIEELRTAILQTRASNDWSSDDRAVLDLVQYSIVRWADDLGRSLSRVAEATTKADASVGAPTEARVRQLEEALVQVGSARDKLIAAAVQVLGVPSLVLQAKGVKFEPRDRALKNALSALGSTQPHAGQLKSRLDALEEHPVISLRNQITHALSPLGEVVENCWIRTAHLDERGGIGDWERGPLYPRHTLDQGDITPETIWKWAIDSAGDAYDLLVEATRALARLTQNVGEIARPEPVYRWPNGKVQLDPP